VQDIVGISEYQKHQVMLENYKEDAKKNSHPALKEEIKRLEIQCNLMQVAPG